MVLVFLEVNGRKNWKECDDMVAARQQADAWLAEAKKSFPTPERRFIPRFYEAIRIPAD
jgi:hypothetical protein